MSMPFYVSPEQLMKDKADFARKNIARGRPLVASAYADGIVICAENTSRSLHKVSEIYDRIAFAGVGRYNEFDQLRRSGVQYADIKGYQYSREDVDGRALANLYAQHMGTVFTHEMKPLEVEILVAEVGANPGQDQLFHVLYDGSVVDVDTMTVLGGEAEAIAGRLEARFEAGWDLGAALRAAAYALGGEDRHLGAGELEVAILARANGRRAFRRIEPAESASLLEPAVDEEAPASPDPASPVPASADPASAEPLASDVRQVGGEGSPADDDQPKGR